MQTLRCAALIGLASLVADAMADTVIDTTSGWNGLAFVAPFGLPNTATYGQTVTVPLTNSSLTSFAFEMRQPASATFEGYVMAWNGSMATGSPLYTSPIMSTSSGISFQEITFNTGSLSLTPGGTYVLFASASQIPSSTGSGDWGARYSGNPYSGGEYVYMNNGTDSSQWTTVAWTKPSFDLVFKANFSTIPEPASLALAGLSGLSLMLFRRLRK